MSTSSTVILQASSDAPLVLQPQRRGDALLARMLGAVLDARLARAVPPESGRLIAARAAQLVEPGSRYELANAWARVLRRAGEQRRAGDPRVPLARAEVLATVDEIDELIAVLRSATPVSACAVARARGLLTDGAGPVYRPGQRLPEAVVAVVAGLRGDD